MRLLSKNTQVRQGPLPLVFGPSAVLLLMRGYAEEEGGPDIANGHVLSRAPQWAQAQYQQTNTTGTKCPFNFLCF